MMSCLRVYFQAMNNIYNIKWLETAEEDIIEIKKYIDNEFKSPQISINILNNIYLKSNILKIFPYLYPKLNANRIKFKNLRKFCVSNYLVFYKVNQSKNLILIYRIIYSRRNYSKLL